MNHNAAKHYWEQQILNASPAERIVLLYDGAIRFLLSAKQAIEAGDIQSRFNNNQRAGDIIMYLFETLDLERGGEVAGNLSRIYQYMLNRLVQIDLKNDTEVVDEVVGQLRTLRESWVKIANGGGAPQQEETVVRSATA